MTQVPVSREVVSHVTKRLIKLSGEAPSSEKSTSDYLDLIEDMISNSLLLKLVLASIGVAIYEMVQAASKAESAVIQLGFDHDPEVFETMLGDWLEAVSTADEEENFGLLDLLVEEDHDTIDGFVTLLMSFFHQFQTNLG